MTVEAELESAIIEALQDAGILARVRDEEGGSIALFVSQVHDRMQGRDLHLIELRVEIPARSAIDGAARPSTTLEQKLGVTIPPGPIPMTDESRAALAHLDECPGCEEHASLHQADRWAEKYVTTTAQGPKAAQRGAQKRKPADVGNIGVWMFDYRDTGEFDEDRPVYLVEGERAWFNKDDGREYFVTVAQCPTHSAERPKHWISLVREGLLSPWAHKEGGDVCLMKQIVGE